MWSLKFDIYIVAVIPPKNKIWKCVLKKDKFEHKVSQLHNIL